MTITSFFAWSLSFYPQPLLNYRRRSTAGLTVDFPLLNVLGFTCYTVYTAALLFSPNIREQYARRHPHAPDSTVRPNDFAFALHALILCLITYSQLWSHLWKFEALPGKRATNVTYAIFGGSIAAILVVAVIVLLHRNNIDSSNDWAALDIVSSH